MKAILEYNLDEPQDVDAHKRAIKSLDMAIALWDIEQYLRAQTKYNENLTDAQYDVLDKAKTEFYDILNRHNISLDELMN